MENKNQENLDQPVTLRHFQEFTGLTQKNFKEFTGLTQKNFKEFTEVNEKRFKEFTDKAFKIFATKQDLRETEERIIEKTSIQRNEVLSSNDEVAKKLDTVRTEQKSQYACDKRQDDKLEELDERVVRVEIKTGIAIAGS
ncbi:hypothetical protein L6279_02020 [Candidatus Parcubacteria bacterium]|nr:hypothetical protein [Candidatus Parcubacteria bacterium]